MIERVDLNVSNTDMKTKFQITNIGKIPAYILIRVEAFLDGELIKDRDVGYDLALMPGQIIYQPGLTLTDKNEVFKQILNRTFSGEFIQNIRVIYGTEKKSHEYFIFQKIKFDQKEFPRKFKDSSHSGVWNIIESDFK